MAGAVEKVFPAKPLAVAGQGLVISPFQFTLTGNENLRVISFNSLTGVRLAIQGAMFDENGQFKPFGFPHTPNTDRSAAVQTFKLGKGALSTVTVFAEAGSPLHGQTFCIVQLVLGLTGATYTLGTLISGYITSRQALGWPGSPIVSSLEGQGVTRFLTGTDPAAGSPVIEVVPTGARWELLAFSTFLVTDATVANREPYLLFENTVGSVYSSSGAVATQAASLGRRYSWSEGLSLAANTSTAGTSFLSMGLPAPNLLPEGHQIIVNAVNFQAGDNFTAPAYTVREWLEGA